MALGIDPKGILQSTIVLTANVGFLAIQSVDEAGMTSRTMGQIVSYLSILLTIGNIAACTMLSWEYRRSTHRHPENAVRARPVRYTS